MNRLRRVKILATLGPSSSSKTVIQKLFKAGADMFRINMSHCDHYTLCTLVSRIREVEKTVKRPIGILVDLQGPKLRIGRFLNGEILINPGDQIIFDCNSTLGNNQRVNLPHPEVLKALRPNHRILIDDGRIVLKVIEACKNSVICQVLSGKMISDCKGISLPDTELETSSLTEKDRSDLEVALNNNVDWVALSFVQRSEDIIKVRSIINNKAAILAKIEKPQALKKLKDIVELSDAIMVARGDLGVEVPLETVPVIQKHVIHTCRKVGKPVVIATQMLESMINASIPTRAEASDVANAVYEGVDAIMLSAESASGNYPVEAVKAMNAIAENVEADPGYRDIICSQRLSPKATTADAISAAARQIAETLNLAVIVCYTGSGATGLRVARERPNVPILALSPIIATGRKLSLAWGLHCVITEDASNFDNMVKRACLITLKEKIAKPENNIIITAGVPFGTPGATNMLRISSLSDFL